MDVIEVGRETALRDQRFSEPVTIHIAERSRVAWCVFDAPVTFVVAGDTSIPRVLGCRFFAAVHYQAAAFPFHECYFAAAPVAVE